MSGAWGDLKFLEFEIGRQFGVGGSVWYGYRTTAGVPSSVATYGGYVTDDAPVRPSNWQGADVGERYYRFVGTAPLLAGDILISAVRDLAFRVIAPNVVDTSFYSYLCVQTIYEPPGVLTTETRDLLTTEAGEYITMEA